MTFYMIRDKLTGLWYSRRPGHPWVAQDRAAVWTTKSGARGTMKRLRWRDDKPFRDCEPEVVALATTERPNPQWVQCASNPDCCPITPDDKRHEELPSID
jgi:hypothetical protein